MNSVQVNSYTRQASTEMIVQQYTKLDEFINSLFLGIGAFSSRPVHSLLSCSCAILSFYHFDLSLPLPSHTSSLSLHQLLIFYSCSPFREGTYTHKNVCCRSTASHRKQSHTPTAVITPTEKWKNHTFTLTHTQTYTHHVIHTQKHTRHNFRYRWITKKCTQT